ncbi:hypothetical protein OIE66_21140 [Nonomuraea sp. NBC_01738]|uniref:hypothetical protein n=1 Tax=Nonomuraea sp. NBC_01738 TaxID=2976003 RepID=UPI002E14214A|nr:hypothetical protein OIE66_21140 [Nonomuraea sp. NBC_01738]
MARGHSQHSTSSRPSPSFWLPPWRRSPSPQVCTGATGSNVRRLIDYAGNGICQVHLGMDRYLSQQDAPGDLVTCHPYGADPRPQYLFAVPVPVTYAVAGPDGLSSECDRRSTRASDPQIAHSSRTRDVIASSLGR